MKIRDALAAADSGFVYRTYELPLTPGQDFALRLKNSRFLQFHIDLIDPAGAIRMQDMSYHEGESAWFRLSESPSRTSLNAIPGPIPGGAWRLWAALRSIPEADGSYPPREYEISWTQDPAELEQISGFFPQIERDFSSPAIPSGEPRWLKGDLHSHTTLSDGLMTPEEKMAFAEQKGFDYYAITDHNVTPGGWIPTSVLPLQSTELTTPDGHMNLIGLSIPLPFGESGQAGINDVTWVCSRLKAIKQSGVFCILNHPMFPPWHCRWEDFDLSSIDSLEIICDPTHPRGRQCNEDALQLWNRLLNDGHRIWGNGGSDSHGLPGTCYQDISLPSDSGDPATYVYSRPDTASILKALKAGQMTVSRTGRLDWELRQDAQGSWAAFVTLLHEKAPIEEDSFEVRLILDGVPVFRGPYLRGDTCRIPFSISEGYHWVRAELHHPAYGLCAFTNPRFWGERVPSSQKIGAYLNQKA